MRAASQAEHGLILVTGATGSGKTRTLYALLQAITGEQKNIVTVEDPVEMALTGINQVPVNHAQSLDFCEDSQSFTTPRSRCHHDWRNP